ncbi:uncharacterized protein LOC116805717 [Drosophila grimshawi]|uniref:uncharacterized protein LOC116805717 n=1 Tax=Drosophila grimshawi TaxID=7222 RepID=UPI0013EF2A27|nr:uncharacterized protein LOC116805717 [Drosophila grimshawi]
METEMSAFINPNQDAEVNQMKDIKVHPLKNCKKEMMLKQEHIDQEHSVIEQVQQRGILIEKGIKELVEDCEPKRPTQQTVKETRYEFEEQLNLDAKYTPTRGVRIEAEQKVDEDFLESAENLMDKLREEYAMQFNSDIQPTKANVKEVHKEEDLIESRNYADGITQEKIHSSMDMATIIDDINHFSERLEINCDNIDLDLMAPLNDLAVQSKALSNHIECIDNKISILNLRVEIFYKKYNRTLLNREKAARDMMSLQVLRETIGRKLTQIEMEIHSSKTRLLLQRE